MSATTPTPLLRVTEEDGRTAVRFAVSTRLTEDNVEAVGRELAALLDGRERPQLFLDLGAVDYLTSVALGKLVALNRQVRGAGGRLSLVNLQPQVRQVFAVSRLDRVLDIRATP